MKYRPLGSTGMTVSEAGFGAWAVGGSGTLGAMVTGWGTVSEDNARAALETAFESGVSFFDTADIYGNGHSEELIAEVLGNKRHDIVIASKGGNRTIDGAWAHDFSADYIEKALEGSLKRLGTDYIDVYFLHTPVNEDEFSICLKTLEKLERLREQGTIRASGISVYTPEQGVAMILSGLGKVIQVRHSILETEAEKTLFPLAEKEGVGIVSRIPLYSGFLSGKYTKDTVFGPDDHRSQSFPPEKIAETVDKVERLRFLERDGRTLAQAALQYILSQSAVSTVIPGAKNPVQAKANAQAGEMGPMTEDELRRIAELTSAWGSSTAQVKGLPGSAKE